MTILPDLTTIHSELQIVRRNLTSVLIVLGVGVLFLVVSGTSVLIRVRSIERRLDALETKLNDHIQPTEKK
jgi:cell division protein FtsB